MPGGGAPAPGGGPVEVEDRVLGVPGEHLQQPGPVLDSRVDVELLGDRAPCAPVVARRLLARPARPTRDELADSGFGRRWSAPADALAVRTASTR